MTHTTANCYWPGGGKEGQFPPNFGQQNRANAAASNVPTTNQPEHFILSARILDTPGQSGIVIDTPTDQPSVALISQGFQKFQNGKVPTFMDSGASDTMFVSKEYFTDYKAITPRVGEAKAEGGNFEIVGEGSVVQRYQVDGKEQTVTYTRTLHTPALNANLISISTLDKAGLLTTFGNGKGITRTIEGTVILASQHVDGMYLLDVVDSSPDISLALTSLSRLTSLEQWHQRLTHCSPSTIQEMATKNLVDGLDLSENIVNGRCENCILGQQTYRPFIGETEKDLAPLELIAFDLWGPSRVQSVGGKIYMMMIVGGTSYKSGTYLPDKSDTTTIPAFNNFHATAETLTGRKIHQLKTDGTYDSNAR